ncbi:MAG: pyridoxal-dependent decarboxylase, exosortase A system-associated, partial [Sedimenticola sp.]|nr:pyridoxal-dependent decarboxylase, exosortase A system-associated [Sedimenticola sp.]
MKATPRHETMAQFPLQNNQLQIGGIPLSTLAARVGQTPFYAYDRKLISARVSALRTILPDTINLHYAIKANSMPAVVQHLSAITDGLDVASLGEMTTALDTGVSPGNISFAGPGKTDKELTAAVAAGVIINMESEGEMER